MTAYKLRSFQRRAEVAVLGVGSVQAGRLLAFDPSTCALHRFDELRNALKPNSSGEMYDMGSLLYISLGPYDH